MFVWLFLRCKANKSWMSNTHYIKNKFVVLIAFLSAVVTIIKGVKLLVHFLSRRILASAVLKLFLPCLAAPLYATSKFVGFHPPVSAPVIILFISQGARQPLFTFSLAATSELNIVYVLFPFTGCCIISIACNTLYDSDPTYNFPQVNLLTGQASGWFF